MLRSVSLFVLLLSLVACGSQPSAPSNVATPPAAETPPPPPPGPATTFRSGQHRVGADIAVGRYYTDPSSGCYWERQSGTGGTTGEILANEFIGFNASQWIVDILASDVAFRTDAECGTWGQSPIHGAQATITPGMWLVGAQIAAGTYVAQVNDGCYWERLRNFEGRIESIIANDFVSGGGQRIVTIAASDAGFMSDAECGTWTPSQSMLAPAGSQSVSEIQGNSDRHRASIRR